MGLSVINQINTKNFFSLSTISKERMAEHGLTMSVEELKEKARRTVPHCEILTGRPSVPERQRLTKIWRYEDFK